MLWIFGYLQPGRTAAAANGVREPLGSYGGACPSFGPSRSHRFGTGCGRTLFGFFVSRHPSIKISGNIAAQDTRICQWSNRTASLRRDGVRSPLPVVGEPLVVGLPSWPVGRRGGAGCAACERAATLGYGEPVRGSPTVSLGVSLLRAFGPGTSQPQIGSSPTDGAPVRPWSFRLTQPLYTSRMRSNPLSVGRSEPRGVEEEPKLVDTPSALECRLHTLE